MPNVFSTSFCTFCVVIPHGSLKLKRTMEKLHQSIMNTHDGEMVFTTYLSWDL